MATPHDVYRQTLPDTLPPVITCRGCGHPMKLVLKRERVAFWAHWGEYHPYHEACPTKVAYRTSYLTDLQPFIKARLQRTLHQEEKESGAGL